MAITGRYGRGLGLLLSIGLLGACGVIDRLSPAPEPDVTQSSLPWDVRPEAPAWYAASRAMLLEGPAAPLIATAPADIDAWCPAYRDAGPEQRAEFWTGLMAALARYESTWQPDLVAGGGRYYGLMQISPPTARFYGCEAGSGEALLDGEANLRCTLRIWSQTVPRDDAVSDGGGVAADWGPMTRSGPREEMRAFSLAQPYCQ